MIRIEHLQKSFKNQKILKDINMQLEEGKVYVLIAPNGTGKTTLLSILAGLTTPDDGTISFEGEVKRTGFSIILSGERNLYMKNTVQENLLYLCVLKGMNTQEAIRNIEREKENFPLYESVRDKVVETLSYGQKRLIALMSAIVSGESCIIIDEATDGLDVNNRKILSNAIRKAAKGRIVLVVAHDLTFASQIAFLWEIKMDLHRTFRYHFGLITDIIVYFGLFTVFMITDSGMSYGEQYGYANYKGLILLGYIAWIYAVSAISNIANSVHNEAAQGILYKKISSKYPLQILFFSPL